jgi:hypothetical protein
VYMSGLQMLLEWLAETSAKNSLEFVWHQNSCSHCWYIKVACPLPMAVQEDFFFGNRLSIFHGLTFAGQDKESDAGGRRRWKSGSSISGSHL